MNESSARAATAVVLVEYRSGGVVDAKAQSLLDAGFQVVVADNSGGYAGPGRRVDTGHNVGFGAGCNAAVASLPTEVDVVVLHNPDLTVSLDVLDRMITAVRDDGWAAVAPALVADRVRPDGFARPGSLREVGLVVRDRIRLHRTTRAGDRSADTPPVVGDGRQCGVVDGSHRLGSAALVVLDRASFDAVGGFDEDFFLYVEDLDLWDRLVQAGHRVGFLPDALARHVGGAGSDASTTRRSILRWIGREVFAAKRDRNWRWLRLLHRLGSTGMDDGDPVVSALLATLRTNRSPSAVSADVRVLMETREPPVTTRVLVLTLRSGEAEFDSCRDAIGRQVGVEVEHVVIADRSNVDAHRELYDCIERRAAEFDLFVKVDADTVLASETVLADIARVMLADPELDHAQFALHDFYTDAPLMGLHAFSPRVRWPRSDEELFVDPAPAIPGRRVDFWVPPFLVGDHSPAPSVEQALGFGVHRTRKALQLDRERISGAQAAQQWRTLLRTWEAFDRTLDFERGVAMFGAELVLAGRVDRSADYRGPEVAAALADLPTDASELHAMLSTRWARRRDREFVHLRRLGLRGASRLAAAEVRLAMARPGTLGPGGGR